LRPFTTDQRFISGILNESPMARIVFSVQLVPVQQHVLQTRRDRGIFGLWAHVHAASVRCSTGSQILSDVNCSFVDCNSPNCVRSQYHTIQSHNCALFCQMEWVNPVPDSIQGSHSTVFNPNNTPMRSITCIAGGAPEFVCWKTILVLVLLTKYLCLQLEFLRMRDSVSLIKMPPGPPRQKLICSTGAGGA
jgi:hypothetical protein